jgi:hypothetical protein
MLCDQCGQINFDLAKRCVACGVVMSPMKQEGPGNRRTDDGGTMRQDESFDSANTPTAASTSHISGLEPARNLEGTDWRRRFKQVRWAIAVVCFGVGVAPLLPMIFKSMGATGHFFSQEGWLLLLAPVLIGAITVYVKEGKGRLRWRDYLIAPVVTLSYLTAFAAAILGVVYLLGCAGIGGIVGGLGGVAVCVAGGLAVATYAAVISVIALPFIFLAGALGGFVMGFLYRLISGAVSSEVG